jgi:hypothetical protein
VILPAGARAFDLRPISAKPELTQNRSGEALPIETPVEKVRRFHAPENRIEQDAVLVWHSGPSLLGEDKLTVDSYSGQTGARVGRIEFAGDGKNPKCDLSADGKRFAAASTNGLVTVWNLADRSKPLEDFDPYREQADHKRHGLAAVYFGSDPDRLVTVSSAGAVHLFQISNRKLLGEFVPPGALPGRVELGKSVAADDARASVVLAVGGMVYQLPTTAPLAVAWKIDLKGEASRSLGIAVVGVPGRVAYAFETDGPKKRERAVLFALPQGEPVLHRWPETAGEPTGIHWSGTNMAIVATTRGAVWVDSSEKSFLPVALAETPGGGLHAATESFHWYLIPRPGDAARSLLVSLSLPPQDLLEFRNAAQGRQPLATVRLDEQGLWK